MTADVELDAVTHRFGAFTALDDVDLHIDAGRFAVLLGPSGCGKTTLLSIVGGFLTPTNGAVRIGGIDVTALPPARRPTTTMFQDYALFPHMTLGANVGFGLRMRGMKRGERDRRAGEMLDLVGLRDAFDKKPHELSGGQRQRVALARALAVEPDVLLLDEPLGALDLKLRRQMQDELKAIQKRVGTTFVHVTHDQDEAMAIADDIIVMNEGRIRDTGAPEAIYLRPRSEFSAAFMGEANLVAGTVREIDRQSVVLDTGFGIVELPAGTVVHEGVRPRDRVTLCFRPEHVDPALEGESVVDLGPAAVTDTAFFGTHHRVHLTPARAGDARIVAHLPQTRAVAPGDRIQVRLNASMAVVLAAEEG